MNVYPDLNQYQTLKQAQIDWLKAQGVPINAVVNPRPIMVDDDGRLVFPEPEDVVFWHPKTGAMDVWNGKAFALGEEAIWNAGTYVFDAALNIYPNPLEWLRADRKGIFIIRWGLAFDCLRDVPRIAVPAELMADYKRYMKPPRMPQVRIVGEKKAVAA